ncbi:MAG: class I SAM-dependent methyltransferase [Pseudomonadota bacterium]
MSDADRSKWDSRYAAGAYGERRHPSPFLVEQCRSLALSAPLRALDVACGAGRNALYLAGLGMRVDAVDISNVALNRLRQSARDDGVTLETHCHDLDLPLDLPGGAYGLIVMVRYVNARLLAALPEMLQPGGILLVEEHLTSHVTVNGPGSARFRLPAGALRHTLLDSAAVTIDLLHEFEGLVEEPDGERAALTQVVARRRSD